MPRQKLSSSEEQGIRTIGIDGKMNQKMGEISKILPDNITRAIIGDSALGEREYFEKFRIE